MTLSKVTVRSPVNIALIKYWGKADPVLVLPTTTSVSLTLSDLYTETSIEPSDHFSFSLNGVELLPVELKRVQKVLDAFPQVPMKITSINSFPTAAGLASSASGIAALVVGLKEYFKKDLAFDDLVKITRQGSGSAVRSLVDGFAVWHQAGHVEALTNPFPNLKMLVAVVSDEKKTISSRDAMKITQATAPTYPQWLQDSKNDYRSIRNAILNEQLDEVGAIMEKNSDRLHAVMKDSSPSIVYQTQTSLHILQTVRALRKEGYFAYYTMDAGPNVKILTHDKDADKILERFQKVFNLSWIVTSIGGFAHAI